MGRTPKHTSNAEKQRAYRERKRYEIAELPNIVTRLQAIGYSLLEDDVFYHLRGPINHGILKSNWQRLAFLTSELEELARKPRQPVVITIRINGNGDDDDAE